MTNLTIKTKIILAMGLLFILSTSAGISSYLNPHYSLVLNILIPIGTALFLYHIYRILISAARKLDTLSEALSKGDLSIQINSQGKDEFSILASHFNSAITELNKFIFRIITAINESEDKSKHLSNVTAMIANNAREQSSRTIQAATAMEEMNHTFSDVAKSTGNAATSAKQAAELAIQGGGVVSETINGMNRIAQSVRESAKTIESLGQRSQQIGDIIKVIDDIANQTNLLALNAAIEAARAGEQGRGFAVVADEVRKLAEKTTAATKEISEMIKGIQDETKMAVESMQIGTKEVEEEVRLANQAGTSLQQIVVAVQDVTDMIQQIATAAEEQSAAGDEISASIESIAKITEQTVANAQESSEATVKLHTSIEGLLNLTTGFKVSSR